jgi:riboflavin kinase/FMN adenylyltransferase
MHKSVLTLGTFDGVHRGHQRILSKVTERARRLHVRSVALAFAMPPRLGHTPSVQPVLLTTLQDKLRILKRLGIDRTEVLVFNKKLAAIPPEQFFMQRILKRCGAQEMVVGPRVAFGKKRAGRLPLLKQLGRASGVRIHVVGGVEAAGKTVSSSGIREALLSGDVDGANRQLGYPYSVSGQVVHGNHRGHKLGYPTANISVDRLKILPPGVFWVKVLPVHRPFPLTQADMRGAIDGLCNVGTRPTFYPKAQRLVCEVYLFKKPGSLYGKPLRVVFMKRIRAEKRFKSSDELKRQIRQDFAVARRWSR